jgi:trehalose 6-phosphate phosphatase
MGTLSRGDRSPVDVSAFDPHMIERIDELARTAVLLVASDFDGTLAPIVLRPEDASPVGGAVAALRSLARLDDTFVAVVSGRSRGDLARRCPVGEPAILVGSHGAELGDERLALDDTAHARLDALWSGLDAVALGGSGLRVERKPSGGALHYREATREAAQRALDEVLGGALALDGLRVRHGKAVVELSVIHTDKGTALSSLRRTTDASAVLFVGDDETDEDAFRSLGATDVSIKVGEGPSAARHRVADPEAVVSVLELLHDRRRGRRPFSARR